MEPQVLRRLRKTIKKNVCHLLSRLSVRKKYSRYRQTDFDEIVNFDIYTKIFNIFPFYIKSGKHNYHFTHRLTRIYEKWPSFVSVIETVLSVT